MYMDVRVYLGKKFDRNNPEHINQVEGLKNVFETSEDTQQKFVASHVLWHVILNCDWPREEIFAQNYLSLLDFPDVGANLDDLAFLNGFANVYLAENANSNDEIFADLLCFCLKSSFQRKPIDFYWYFHVVDNLLKKYKKRASKNDQNSNFKSKIENFTNLVLKLTQANWDNKFPRVSELGVEIFRNFFTMFGRSILNVKVDQMILEYLNVYPFYVRGKFRMIAKLVEMVTLEEFCKFEYSLWNSLNVPASSNHLAPFVGTVYKTVLHFISKNLSQMSPDIIDRWLNIVVENLCNTNDQLRYNTMKHFIPAVVKYLPQFYDSKLMTEIRSLYETYSESKAECYLSKIEPRSLCSLVPFLEPRIGGLKNENENSNIELVIWAYALLLKHSASVKESKLTEKDKKFLEKALIVRDDSSRMEAFDFWTDFSNDGNIDRVFMPYEKCLKFLGENFLVSDPSFRRRLVRSFSKYLDYSLRKTCKDNENRPRCIEFIHECLKLCWTNLFPEANYQRMSSSLNILEAIVENSIKYNILDDISPTFERNFQILIRGLQNSSGDIRESCGRILTKVLQSRPLPIDQSDQKSKLLDIATNLSNSPKELDCQSGAALWNLIFRKKVGNFDLQSIFNDMRTKFESLKRSVLKASYENPLHGFLTAAKIYLLVNSASYVEFDLARNFVKFCAEVTDFFNRMLGSSTEGECPSLEQMDISLAKISLSNDLEDGNLDESDLHNDRQLVLACCWLNIKHSAFLLSTIARSKIEFENLEVSRRFYQHLGDTFFEMMTRTRHWGVLEGCSEAFGDFCKFCSQHDDPVIKKIPLDILSKVCDHVAKPKAVSITRRAVGFPMMIQCIAVNTNPIDQRNVLSVIFARLLTIAEQSIESYKMNDLSDIPLVRAMHCLRLLIRNSQIGLDVLKYLSPIYNLILQHISSSVWPIRNAAMLLLSALIWRLFGRLGIQMTNENNGQQDETILDDNTFTLSEFRFLFDEILQTCRIYLRKVMKEEEKPSTNNNFVIFAIFSVLKNICITKDDWKFSDDEEDRLKIQEMVRNVEHIRDKSCDYRLRRTANDILSKFHLETEKREYQYSRSLKSIIYKFNRSEFPSIFAYYDNFLTKIERGVVDVEEFLSFFNVVYKNPASFFQWSESRDEIFWNCILKCCARNYGISVQCLALPIFAALLEKKRVESRFLPQFANTVHECSLDTRSETCRMAAAHCLVICKKLWLENSDLVTDEIRSRFIMDAINLLLDEDAEIRSVICQISSSNDVSAPSNFVLCLENLVSKLNANEFLVDEILRSYFTPKLADFRLDQSGQNSQRKFLFRQSDFNIFKENFYVQSLFYRMLKRYLQNCSISDRKKFFEPYSNMGNLMNSAEKSILSAEESLNAEFYALIYGASMKIWTILDLKLTFDEESSRDLDSAQNFLSLCKERLHIGLL